MKILVLSYSLSPDIGSEYAVGWNHIQTISQDHEVTVIFGETSGNFSNFDTRPLENHLQRHHYPNINFIPCKAKLNKFQEIISRVISKIPHNGYKYKLWHFEASQIAKTLILQQKIDVIQYLNPIGFKEPGYIWTLNAPYVWGPVQGVHVRPLSLLNPLPLSEKIGIISRNIFHLAALRFLPRVRKALRSADVVIAATTKSQQQFKTYHNIQSLYLPENGVTNLVPVLVDKFSDPELQLVWIGRIDARKSLITVFDSLRKIPNLKQIKLHVVGTGPLLDKLKTTSVKYGINNQIVWHGQIPRDKVFDLLTRMHIHILTSNGEGNPTVIWEAMAMGIPTMALDHCGMHDTISKECGFLIPLSSYSKITDALANKIIHIAENRNSLRSLSETTFKTAESHLLSTRRQFYNQVYSKALESYTAKRRTI